LDNKILIGRDNIKSFIGITSNELFQQFITSGMPAKLINGRWYAHKDNVELYFKNITNIKNKGRKNFEGTA